MAQMEDMVLAFQRILEAHRCTEHNESGILKYYVSLKNCVVTKVVPHDLTPFIMEGNHLFGFHGTKLVSMDKILDNGFVIPEEKPGMFGEVEGVFLTPSLEKSIQYTDFCKRDAKDAVILLCEVVLGDTPGRENGYTKHDTNRAPKKFVKVNGMKIPTSFAPPREGAIDHHNFNDFYCVSELQRIKVRYVLHISRAGLEAGTSLSHSVDFENGEESEKVERCSFCFG